MSANDQSGHYDHDQSANFAYAKKLSRSRVHLRLARALGSAHMRSVARHTQNSLVLANIRRAGLQLETSGNWLC